MIQKAKAMGLEGVQTVVLKSLREVYKVVKDLEELL